MEVNTKKAKRRLYNFDISEVSLVDRPANNRPFLLFKRNENAPTEIMKESDLEEPLFDDDNGEPVFFEDLTKREQKELMSKLTLLDCALDLKALRIARKRLAKEDRNLSRLVEAGEIDLENLNFTFDSKGPVIERR